MKHLNFSTKSGSQSGSHRVVTLASIVGSPSAHRRGTMLRLLSVLVLILTIGVGQMWGAEKTGTFTMSTANQTSPVSNNGVTFAWTSSYIKVGSGSGFAGKSGTADMVITIPSGATLTGISKTNGNTWGATNIDVYTGTNKNGTKVVSITENTHSYTISSNNTGTSYYLVNSASKNAWINSLSITYTEGASCSNNVSTSAKTAGQGQTNGSVSVGSTSSVATCSSTATDRQITVTVTPDAVFGAPTDLTTTGTASAPAKQSGPTNNNNGTYSYVYRFTQNTSGTCVFGASFVDQRKTVSWEVNGTPLTSGSQTTKVVSGSKVTTLPTAPVSNDCDGTKVFVGWTATENYSNASTPPTDLFITAAGAPTVTDNVTYYAVFATNATNATRVTSASGMVAGNYYVFVNAQSNYTKLLKKDLTVGSTIPTEENSKISTQLGECWLITGDNSTNGFTITSSSNKILGLASSPSNGTSVTNTTTRSKWILGAGATNFLRIWNKDHTSYKIEYYNSGSCWAVYNSTSSSYVDWKVYKVNYSNYETNCCQPLGSINGSVSLTQSGNDLVASGWGATTGGNETGYLVKLYNSTKSEVLDYGNTAGTAKTYTFTNPGAGTYWVSVTPTYSGAGNYCATGDETFSAASIDISGKMVITFKKNGATGTDDQTQEVDYNIETALEDVSARSYTAPSCKEFGGWASSEANATAGTVAYANGANITVTEATTLWAIWKTKTFAVTDGTIASSVASHSYSVNTIACGNDLTITCAAAAAYKGNPTVTATGTHGAITVNSATSVTIANVQSAIAISIAYNTPKEAATVILHDATGAHTQADPYYEADNYTLPNTAAACTESELYGWYTETYVDQPTAPSGEKYIAKEASKTLVAGENHFYAVYATIEDRYTNNYTKITSAGDLTSGDYLISSGSYCMGNTIQSTNRMAETSLSAVNNVKSNPAASLIWTITKSGSKVTLYNDNVSKYLAVSGGVIAVQNDAHNFTFDYGTTKADSWTFTSESSPTYQLSYSTISGNSYNYFVMNTSQSAQIDLYKRDKAPSAGAPYTTSPNCTTHDLTSAIDPISPVSGTVELGKETLVEGKTTTATATPSAHYTFSHWTISGTDAELDDANANPVTVTMGTADAEITAHFTEKEKCTVEFYNNGGSALSSTTYWLGETPTAPTLTDGHDHDACDENSTVHYGWTQTAWTETLTKEQVDAKTAADVKVYAKAAALPAVAAGDNGKTIKYYAVWAQASGGGSASVFSEGFSSCEGTGGNDDSWSGSIATTTLPTSISSSWSITAGNAAKGCIKLGAGSTTGHAITPFIDCGSATTATLTFRAGAWNNNDDGTTLTLSYTNCSGDKSSVTLAKGSFTEYTVNLSNITDDIKIDFYVSDGSKHRFFLDDVDVTCAGGTSYSAFLTSCAVYHSVSYAVSPAGKATVTLGANSVAEGSTTTAEYSVITAGYEFVNWTVSGTGASLDDNTANPTTITMGTADVTVTANLQCVKPTFTVHPASKINYLTTDVATALGYTASAAGASLTQQWQISSNNVDWSNIEGEAGTAAIYTPVISTEGTKYYRVVVTNSECDESKTSEVATITSIAPSGYCISLFNSNNNGIQSGFSNGGSGNEYTLAFVVPGKDGSNNWPEYWIGENEAWASFSANATIADMKFTTSDATVGLAEGATGTLHIWDDNKTNNLHAKFEPDGYGFRWGDHESDDWTAEACTKAFTVDANNPNTYWTELVTLDGTNNTAWDYYVGLQTASGYVYSGVDNEASDSRGISRTRSVTTMKVSNGSSGQYKATYLDSEPTGTTGKFRIWNNNITDYNFVCHFVPFYQLKYNANGGTGTMDPLPATPVSCEESAANRTVTVAANAFTAPTGKQFLKWNTSANGSGADVAVGAYELTGDVTLYAIWADADYTVTVNQSPAAGATTTGQTTTAHYNGTINLTTTVPDGYEFVNWTSSDVTITNPTSVDGASFTMPAQNVTVTANFQQIHTITWSVNGATTTSTVNAGNKLVLPVDEPESCNAGYSTFIGWYSAAAGTAEDPSDNVSGTKADADHTPTGDETYYAVWANGDLVGGWQKATSIAVGDVVVFVHETASREMTSIALIGSNMCGNVTEYTTSPAGTYPLTIVAGSVNNSYAFQNGSNYLSYSGTGNTLSTSTDLNGASSWTINASADGNFKFANVTSDTRIMQFNNNSAQYRWACYTSDQTAFQIYKQTAGATGFISNCCEEWTATAKYGESNVINVNDVVAVTVTGTVHGTASYESDDTDVLTVAFDGKITGKKAGSATVTISWAGADGYCAYETTVEVTVNGAITVTYNANDGSLTPATTSQNATSNSAFTLDANSFSRTGYTFQGWATTPNGDKEYNNSQADVEFAENVTLYAVWSINSHAVTLNQPTGNTIEATGAANLASVAYGTPITLSATENDGYVFTGWSATGVILANTNPVVFTMPDNDVTVTATYSTYDWIAADPHYTVTTDPKISYTKVEKFSTAGVVIKENFKRSDDNTITKQETYGGAWTAKLNGVTIANGADLSLDDNGKTLKLYIGEEEIASYTLTVSDVAADQFIDGLWGETFDVQTGNYDMPTPSSHAAGATDCAKHNTFAGWILEANAENPTVENIITGAAATGVTAANNTYYAVWSKSENVNKEFTVSKTGFASSEISSGTISTGITYTTQKNGGSTTPSLTGTSLRLYQILSGQKDGNSITISGASGVTLTKVEFITTGSAYGYVTNSYTTGNTTALTSGTVTDGKITLEDLSTDKLTVVNMATNSSRLDISKIEVTYEKMVTEVDYITDCDPRYDVEFLAGDGATGSYDKVTKKAGVEITLPDGSALSKDHHTFAGWYSAYYDVTYSESTSMTYTVPVDGDILEAQWTEDNFGTVSFKNGETTTSTIKVYDGGTFDLAAALVEAGKEFIGWKWNGSMYTAGQANQHMTNPAEDRTYTAVWMPVIDVATADAADLSDGKWILVQNKSQLKAGDFIVIAAAGYNAALSNYQKTGNRGDAAVTKIADTLTYTSNVAPLFLQYDPENDYYAFYDRAYTTNTDVAPSQKGYLYAPNALKTQTGITMQGIWAIDIADKKASIVAQGNNSDKIMRYNKGSNLFNCYGTATQSDIAIYKWAKNISSDMNVSDVTNTDMVIVTDGNTLTIDQSATLDNLIVEAGGKVSGSATLNVQDMTIESEPSKSGQVTSSDAHVNGDIYLEIKLLGDGTGTMTTEESQMWYCISAPFEVSFNDGFFWGNGTPMGHNEDFQAFVYDGAKRASNGTSGWQRAGGKMEAGKAYLIGFDDERSNQKTIRLKAMSNTIPTASALPTEAHYNEDNAQANWNGVGNPTLHYIALDGFAGMVQCYNNGAGYSPYNPAMNNYVVGTALFMQAEDNIDLKAATNANFRAPKREGEENENYSFCVEIAKEGATRCDNRLYVSTSDEATSTYEQGKDMQSMNGTSAKFAALIWTENYGMRLASEDVPMVNQKASYTLGIYAPKAGTYSISTVEASEDAELYLTYNGRAIWNLSMSECELELAQGQNAGYGLRLVVNAPSVSTDVDEVQSDNVQCTKVIIDEHVYILRGGQMYDVNGKMVR